MKVIQIAFLLIILFPGMIISQDTTSTVFAPVGAVWHYRPYMLFDPTVGYFKYEVTKDTVLLGYNAREVACLEYDYAIGDFVRRNELDQYVSTLGDQVYYKVGEQFYLLYDFGAAPGDTIHSRVRDFAIFMGCSSEFENGEEEFKYIVSGYDTIIIDGLPLRRQFVTSIENDEINEWGYYEPILERIGYTGSGGIWWGQGFLCVLGGFNGFLRCYSDNTITYQRPGLNYECTFTKIEEPDEISTFKIHPNPASDYILIPDGHTDLKVYDVVGKVYDVAVKDERADISRLADGMYVCVFEMEDVVVSRMFVKGQ